MTEKLELLGVLIPESDKNSIKEIADKNRLSMSIVARLLIKDSLQRLGERDLIDTCSI